MTIMTAQAENDNQDVDAVEEELREAFRRAVDVRVGGSLDFAVREAAGLEIANELCRDDQERDLQQRSAMFLGDTLSIKEREPQREPHRTRSASGHGLRIRGSGPA